MKVTKKLATTTIGEVVNNEITTFTIEDLQGGKHAKKIFNALLKAGRKVFIDSVKTEKVVIDMPDEYVLKAIADNLYRIEIIGNKESEEK